MFKGGNTGCGVWKPLSKACVRLLASGTVYVGQVTGVGDLGKGAGQ